MISRGPQSVFMIVALNVTIKIKGGQKKMTNQRLYALEREYKDQAWECDEFENWVAEKFPTVAIYLRTPDSLGQIPVIPEIYDVQVILKEWQKDHAPINCKVTRATKDGFSYIPEGNPTSDELLAELANIKRAEEAWWEKVDNGTETYREEVIDAFYDQIKDLEAQILKESRILYM